MPAMPMFFFGQCSTRVPSDRRGGGGGLGRVQEEIIYLPSGRVVHCYSFKLMTSPGIVFSTQCIIFQFHEKETPVPSNVNRSKEHWKIGIKSSLERNENKKKKSPVRKMSCNVKTYLPYLNYTLSPLHSEPFPYVSKAFQFVRWTHTRISPPRRLLSFHWYYVLTYRLKTFISLCWIAPRKGSIQSSIPETQIRTSKV